MVRIFSVSVLFRKGVGAFEFPPESANELRMSTKLGCVMPGHTAGWRTSSRQIRSVVHLRTSYRQQLVIKSLLARPEPLSAL